MTQTLEQLSAAATEGEWISIQSSINPDRHYITNENHAIFASEIGGTKPADLKFVTSLVNLYRTGQLVAVADDGERPYLCSTHNQRYGYGEECPECEPVQADDVIQRVAELQLAAFLAGRGSIRTKDNGRTHVSLSGPTMDDYRRMAIAVMKGPKL